MLYNILNVLFQWKRIVAKKVRRKIDWYGNQGRCNPAPGVVETAECGVCGRQMNVERNVLGATSWAESMGHGKHLHDRFTCPNIKEDWHEKIVNLKVEAYTTESDKIKKILEKEIIELLEANAVR